MVEEDLAAALPELDRAPDGTVALRRKLRGFANEAFVEGAVARNLIEKTNRREGLRPFRLTITVGPHGQRAQRLLHFLEQ